MHPTLSNAGAKEEQPMRIASPDPSQMTTNLQQLHQPQSVSRTPVLGHLAQKDPVPFPFFTNNKLQEENEKLLTDDLKYKRTYSQKSARMNLVDDEDLKAQEREHPQKPFTSHQRRSSQKVEREREESGYLNDYAATFAKGQIFSARTNQQSISGINDPDYLEWRPIRKIELSGQELAHATQKQSYVSVPTSQRNLIKIAPHEVAKFYHSPLKFIAQNRDKILQRGAQPDQEDEEIRRINLAKEAQRVQPSLIGQEVRPVSRRELEWSYRQRPERGVQEMQRYMTPTQLFRAKSPLNFKRFLAMGAHQFRPRPLSREKRLMMERKQLSGSKHENSQSQGGISGVMMQVREKNKKKTKRRDEPQRSENLKQVLQIDVKLNNSPRVLETEKEELDSYKQRFGEIKSSIQEVQESIHEETVVTGKGDGRGSVQLQCSINLTEGESEIKKTLESLEKNFQYNPKIKQKGDEHHRARYQVMQKHAHRTRPQSEVGTMIMEGRTLIGGNQVLVDNGQQSYTETRATSPSVKFKQSLLLYEHQKNRKIEFFNNSTVCGNGISLEGRPMSPRNKKNVTTAGDRKKMKIEKNKSIDECEEAAGDQSYPVLPFSSRPVYRGDQRDEVTTREERINELKMRISHELSSQQDSKERLEEELFGNSSVNQKASKKLREIIRLEQRHRDFEEQQRMTKEEQLRILQSEFRNIERMKLTVKPSRKQQQKRVDKLMKEETQLPILLQGRRCDIQIRNEKKLF